MAMTSSISLLGSNFQSLAMTLLMIPTIVLTEMMRTIRRSWLIIIDGSEVNAKKTPRMGLDWIYISKWRFDHVWLIITRITIKAWVSSHYWVTVLMTLAVVRGREDDKPDDTNGSTKSCKEWFSKKYHASTKEDNNLQMQTMVLEMMIILINIGNWKIYIPGLRSEGESWKHGGSRDCKLGAPWFRDKKISKTERWPPLDEKMWRWKPQKQKGGLHLMILYGPDDF